MNLIWEYSVAGVWGETAKFNNDFYGGTNCADQSTYLFRIGVVLALVSKDYDN